MSDAAVVLLSGGLDSYTAAAIVGRQGFRLYALTVRYGQRHAREVDAARAVAAALGVARHLELDVDLRAFGGSSLTTDAPVPKDRTIDPTEIPSTYVPARNTVFLSLALAWAEVLGASDIVLGVNALDYSGYPDCRNETLQSLARSISLGMDVAFAIVTPLMWIDKAATFALAHDLGGQHFVDLLVEETHTCYLGDRSHRHDWGYGCGTCPACRLRAEGFAKWKREWKAAR